MTGVAASTKQGEQPPPSPARPPLAAFPAPSECGCAVASASEAPNRLVTAAIPQPSRFARSLCLRDGIAAQCFAYTLRRDRYGFKQGPAEAVPGKDWAQRLSEVRLPHPLIRKPDQRGSVMTRLKRAVSQLAV